MPSKRRRNAPAGVIDEYAAILRAADGLEQTLASVAATRTRVWRRRLLRGCMPVSTSLRDHYEFAERPGGTLDDVEIVIGRLYELSMARRQHAQLMAHVAELLAAIDGAGDGPQLPADLTGGAARLVAAIRYHCQGEVDLLQLRYILDVGVVD